MFEHSKGKGIQLNSIQNITLYAPSWIDSHIREPKYCLANNFTCADHVRLTDVVGGMYAV